MDNKAIFNILSLAVLFVVVGCNGDSNNNELPPRASGPFEQRLIDGWKVFSVSFEGEMDNPFDTTTQATFKGEARNDSAIVDYRIDFYLNLMLGLAPINYVNQGEGIWAFDSSLQTLWFYDFPDTLTFIVDYDADTLQLWHSNVVINDPSLGEDIQARLDIELRK